MPRLKVFAVRHSTLGGYDEPVSSVNRLFERLKKAKSEDNASHFGIEYLPDQNEVARKNPHWRYWRALQLKASRNSKARISLDSLEKTREEKALVTFGRFLGNAITKNVQSSAEWQGYVKLEMDDFLRDYPIKTQKTVLAKFSKAVERLLASPSSLGYISQIYNAALLKKSV
ncbi:TPA: hypothetical protein HA244_01205 [Candidatus Micrarchaeota archaeon]|nr:hypothetical protein [Candidatus Micrarchaeota archaeon]